MDRQDGVSSELRRPLQKRKIPTERTDSTGAELTELSRCRERSVEANRQVSMSFDYENGKVHPYTQEVSRLGKRMSLLVNVWSLMSKSQHASENVGTGSRLKIPKSPARLNPGNRRDPEEGSCYRLLSNVRNWFWLSSRGNSIKRKISSFSLITNPSSLSPTTTMVHTYVWVHS